MNGNENLPDGFEEEKLGHNAIAAGFPRTKTMD